jgi:hypothetical protein
MGQNGGVTAVLRPELDNQFVSGQNGDRVNLSSGLVVEKVTGSSSFDYILTGGRLTRCSPDQARAVPLL